MANPEPVTTATLPPPRPVQWFRKPGGSPHAFARRMWTLCDRYLWTAAWPIATADEPDRCPECVAIAAAEAR